MTNVQVLGSVTVWNSSKIKGIFHHDKLPMNRPQATSLLIHLNLANLPELTYIWKGTKHSVTLQNLEYLYILGCQKLKVVFSCSVLRSLPQLKILAVLQCEGLEQIIEDDEKHENVSNPAITPKVCFSKLKLILVTQCNSLKRLFHLSAPHEFPELEYLVINQVPTLEEVFEAEQGMREGNIEVLLPKLSQVILMQLPNLNNISQGIEFETLIDLFVHNCPKLSLSSTTTIEDMLQICYDDWKIHLLVHSELLFIHDITNKEIVEKVLMLRTSSPEDQTASGSEQPSFQSIEDAIQENVQEGSPAEEPTKAALSAHTKPGGGDMLAQHSQVVEQGDKPNEEDIGTTPCQKIQNIDDSIQEGSSLLDKEGGTSVVSNDSIEAPLDTLGSHYLTMPKLGTLKDFADFDDVQLSLLGDAIAMYPHLWNVCEKFSKRFQAWMLKILADMLLFLRNKSPVNVTPQQEKEFHGLCVEAVQVGFDGSWVEEMQQRVLVRVPEVHYALARLNELHKNHD